jgi:hypothetical protein
MTSAGRAIHVDRQQREVEQHLLSPDPPTASA